MTGAMIQLLSGAYAITGLIVATGYIPTIKDLFRGKMSANITSYLIWTFCAGVAFLYSIVQIKDSLLSIVNGLNFAACASILAMTISLKIQEKRG